MWRGCLPTKSRSHQFERGYEMFPNSDPSMALDLHHQKVAELIHQATDRRLVRDASTGRRRRFGRWRGKVDRGHGGRVHAAA